MIILALIGFIPHLWIFFIFYTLTSVRYPALTPFPYPLDCVPMAKIESLEPWECVRYISADLVSFIFLYNILTLTVLALIYRSYHPRLDTSINYPKLVFALFLPVLFIGMSLPLNAFQVIALFFVLIIFLLHLNLFNQGLVISRRALGLATVLLGFLTTLAFFWVHLANPNPGDLGYNLLQLTIVFSTNHIQAMMTIPMLVVGVLLVNYLQHYLVTKGNPGNEQSTSLYPVADQHE